MSMKKLSCGRPELVQMLLRSYGISSALSYLSRQRQDDCRVAALTQPLSHSIAGHRKSHCRFLLLLLFLLLSLAVAAHDGNHYMVHGWRDLF